MELPKAKIVWLKRMLPSHFEFGKLAAWIARGLNKTTFCFIQHSIATILQGVQ